MPDDNHVGVHDESESRHNKKGTITIDKTMIPVTCTKQQFTTINTRNTNCE